MHLTMELWMKLNGQTSGKDKLMRLLQYISRFVWYYMEKKKNLRDIVSKLKILENVLSTTRKLLRFGKSFDVLYGALNTLKLSDKVLQATTTMSRIYQSLFLLYDHCIWLSRSGLLDLDKKKLTEYSCRCWLGAIIFNLMRDVYEITRVLNGKSLSISQHNLSCAFQHHPMTKSVYKLIPQTRPIFYFIENHQDIFWDTVKNSCDVWIPLTSLGKTNLSPGIIGILGTISSMAGLISVINPLAKLAPA